MKKLLARHLFRLTLLTAVVSLASCTTTKPGRSNYSTQFDPPAQQPSNPSAVKVKISTVAQRLYVMEGNRVLLATPCSVGTPGDATPAGMHRIQSKLANRRRQSQPGSRAHDQARQSRLSAEDLSPKLYWGRMTQPI